jgi:hypothetical protein
MEIVRTTEGVKLGEISGTEERVSRKTLSEICIE